MKKKTKTLIILGVVLALALALYFVLVVSFHGWLTVRVLFTLQARQYVAEHFPGEALETDFAVYEFKYGSYYCPVQDPQSQDRHFCVQGHPGHLSDDYQARVTSGQNTLLRLEQQLSEQMEEALAAYPHRSRLSYVGFDSSRELDASGLTLDMPLDPQNPPFPVELTLWSETEADAPSWQELEERLTELQALMAAWPVRVDTVSYTLEYPYDEAGEQPSRYDSPIMVENCPVEEAIFRAHSLQSVVQ